ncbi:hypothetical protein [Geodermatophilus sp. FMUSA9-8]|uniref:hypothetical protein n=1 Tax=Geodermatophilus sp. FMUSA9-8 TaxID=3120155 RepID=UPI00300B159C
MQRRLPEAGCRGERGALLGPLGRSPGDEGDLGGVGAAPGGDEVVGERLDVPRPVGGEPPAAAACQRARRRAGTSA